MNKKGNLTKISMIGAALITIFAIIALIVGIASGLNFSHKTNGACDLMYEMSDVTLKYEQYLTCRNSLHNMNFKGHSVLIFKIPQNSMDNAYKTLDSLGHRFESLVTMDKSSVEYQFGMQQLEEEIEYFVEGDRKLDKGSTLSIFKHKYCMDNYAAIFCW